MEYLQLFDENHNAIDEKALRSEKHNLPNGKYYMCSIIFIENNEGKFLMQKTSKRKQSCIATPGGHVTYGDTPLDTIVRECKEEMALVLNNDIKLIDVHKDDEMFLSIYYIKMEIDIDTLVLQPEEVEYVDWYTQKEIENFINKNEFRLGNIPAYREILSMKKSETMGE